MLTPEQIENLKPGDPIVIHTKFQYVDEDGDIKFVAPYSSDGGCFCFISSKFVSLPSEYKTVVDARDVFRNMSEGEKARVCDFLSSYFRESKKQEEMRNALKKMGVDLTNIRPKYDPTRLFKKGDKVRIVEYKGRRTGYDKKIYKVCEDEDESGRYIKLSMDGFIGHFTVDTAYLELVTPVEELEPYKLINYPNTYNIVRDSATVMTIHKKSHPNAKAAAESERDRLNAEYRKEHSNGNE